MTRPTVFERTLTRELAATAGAVFVVLFAIMLSTQLVRLLGQAAGGKISSEAVLVLLGFSALNYLAVLLSLTLFVAVLLTVTRSYRDSEMVIWFSSGVPLTAWIAPVLRFAAPLVLAIALLALWLSPWALEKGEELKKRMSTRDDVAQVSPGMFRESSGAERVFFVEAGSDLAHAHNIFVSSMQHGRLGVMVSSEGHRETAANGDRFLVMKNGRRYEGTPGQPDYRVMRFERYAVRIETKEAGHIEVQPKTMSLVELAASPQPAARGEMLWRIGIPLSALVLALAALPLSFVNPRAGRSNNLVLAILTFMIYSNLISLSQAWVTQGRLAFGIGWWLVHVAMSVLLALLFYRRVRPFARFGR
ncbi:MAG: LPS export ABC transporter permease LptF [Rhodocyclaceae bacterium]